jgi:probable phosphoglycerate mutase
VLAELAERHAGQRIICVTHGGVLDCVYRFATRLPLAAPREHALLNASINVVEFAADSARVVAWADIQHLGFSEDDGLARRM